MSGKKIAIIPARGGSKRIPRKNIKDFYGEPIISYPIKAAIASNYFDKIMVSTDSEEIAKISLSYHAEVPFSRSKKNSNDYASTVDAILEVIDEYANRGLEFKFICCIYPTSPFITNTQLTKSMTILINSGADSVVPVVQYSYPIQRSLKIEGNYLSMVWPENYYKRSQDCEPIYHDSGQYYCLRTKSLLKQKKLFMKKTIPIILAEKDAQDIDTEDDWKIAELKYHANKNK